MFKFIKKAILVASLFSTCLVGCSGQVFDAPKPQMGQALSNDLTPSERAKMLSVLPALPAAAWAKTVVISNGVVYASSHQLAATVKQYQRDTTSGPFVDATGAAIQFPADDFADNPRSSTDARSRDLFQPDDEGTGLYFSEYSPNGFQNLTTNVSIPCDSTFLYNGTSSLPAQTAFAYSGGYDNTSVGTMSHDSGLDIGLQINSDHIPDPDGFAPPGTIQSFVTGPSLNGVHEFTQTAYSIPFTSTNTGNFGCGDGGDSTAINGGLFLNTTDVAMDLYPSKANELTMIYTQESSQTIFLALVIDFSHSAGWSPLGCSTCQVKRTTSLAVPLNQNHEYRPGSYFGVAGAGTKGASSPQVIYTGTSMAAINGCVTLGVVTKVGAVCQSFSSSGGSYFPKGGLTNGVLLTAKPLGSSDNSFGIDEYTKFVSK